MPTQPAAGPNDPFAVGAGLAAAVQDTCIACSLVYFTVRMRARAYERPIT